MAGSALDKSTFGPSGVQSPPESSSYVDVGIYRSLADEFEERRLTLEEPDASPRGPNKDTSIDPSKLAPKIPDVVMSGSGGYSPAELLSKELFSQIDDIDATVQPLGEETEAMTGIQRGAESPAEELFSPIGYGFNPDWEPGLPQESPTFGATQGRGSEREAGPEASPDLGGTEGNYGAFFSFESPPSAMAVPSPGELEQAMAAGDTDRSSNRSPRSSSSQQAAQGHTSSRSRSRT